MSMIKRLLRAMERKHFQYVREDDTCSAFHMVTPEQIDES